MAECEHNTTKRQKFNGGNPVYVCDACDTITGYVHDPVVTKLYFDIHDQYIAECTRLAQQSFDQEFPHD